MTKKSGTKEITFDLKAEFDALEKIKAKLQKQIDNNIHYNDEDGTRGIMSAEAYARAVEAQANLVRLQNEQKAAAQKSNPLQPSF